MAATGKITRDDIEAKFRELSGEFDEKVEVAKPKVLSAAGAGLLLIAIVSYLFGRRRGRKRSAVVEIRRL